MVPIAPRMISAKMTANRLRRDRSPGNSALLVAEAVSDAAYREQVLGLLRIHLDLLPEMPDVDVDRPRVTVRRIAPHAREQHVAREHAPRRARERGEDLELDECRGDRVALAYDGALGRVDAQAADVDRLLVVGLRAHHAG